MLLRIEAIWLAGMTVLLAGPVSAWLARARWPSRSPRAALVLWQAIGLGGGLGILTAGLTLAAGSVDVGWLPGLLTVPSHWSELDALGWFGVALTGCVGAWLVTATIASALRVAGARRAHRGQLDLVADPVRVDGHGGGLDVRLVDHPRAVAYCLPGLRPRVVLSSGALDTLTGAELDAVLEHERAHARGRHDLVIQPFVAWSRTFPFLPTARSALAAVDLLVEMLADDTALRRCSAGDLRAALRRLSEERVTIDGPADPDMDRRLAARAERIGTAQRRISPLAAALIYVASVILVVAPPVLLLRS